MICFYGDVSRVNDHGYSQIVKFEIDGVPHGIAIMKTRADGACFASEYKTVRRIKRELDWDYSDWIDDTPTYHRKLQYVWLPEATGFVAKWGTRMTPLPLRDEMTRVAHSLSLRPPVWNDLKLMDTFGVIHELDVSDKLGGPLVDVHWSFDPTCRVPCLLAHRHATDKDSTSHHVAIQKRFVIG